MNQELEIEFKNLLTKNEFFRLLHEFSLNRDHFEEQTNYYFDTSTFLLKELKSALRIRLKQNKYTLTLKQTVNEGILETHQPLTKYEVDLLLKNRFFPDGAIKTILLEHHLLIDDIQYFGALTTKRAELEYKGGLLVFDQSEYLQYKDYELEYEVTNYKHGYEIFNHLLKTYKIPIRPTKNKVQRFFEASQCKGGSHLNEY